MAGRSGRPPSTINHPPSPIGFMCMDASSREKLQCAWRSGNELVDRDVEEDGAEGPDGLRQEVAEDDAEAEREGLHVEAVAAVAEDGELADPGDEVVEPEA